MIAIKRGSTVRFVSASFVLALVLASGCFIDTVYDPDELTPTIIARRDAGTDTGVDASDAGPVDPDGNPLTRPPARPVMDDSDGVDLTYGLRDIVLDPSVFDDGGWVRFAYDLDGRVTTSSATASCASQVVIADGAGGEDNAFAAQLVEGLQAARGDDLQSYARQRMISGVNIPMVHIAGFNGEDNDPKVTVWVGVSAAVDAGDGGNSADWDGRDVMYPSTVGFLDGDIASPEVYDDNAYVANRILVAAIPDSPIYIPQGDDVPPLALKMNSAILIGTISVDYAELEDVIILGRWNLVEIADALSDSGVCQGTEDRIALDLLLRQFADIRADEASDNQTPAVACNALSVGISFTGNRVILGSETRTRQGSDPPSPCG